MKKRSRGAAHMLSIDHTVLTRTCDVRLADVGGRVPFIAGIERTIALIPARTTIN